MSRLLCKRPGFVFGDGVQAGSQTGTGTPPAATPPAAGSEVSGFTDCHYNDFARGNGSRRCRDATMLRDTLAGLIEPMLASAGAYHPRTGCRILGIRHRTIGPHALKIPAPIGAEPTLAENAAFHFTPRQDMTTDVNGGGYELLSSLMACTPLSAKAMSSVEERPLTPIAPTTSPFFQTGTPPPHPTNRLSP